MREAALSPAAFAPMITIFIFYTLLFRFLSSSYHDPQK
jgi:hypothetical protein